MTIRDSDILLCHTKTASKPVRALARELTRRGFSVRRAVFDANGEAPSDQALCETYVCLIVYSAVTEALLPNNTLKRATACGCRAYAVVLPTVSDIGRKHMEELLVDDAGSVRNIVFLDSLQTDEGLSELIARARGAEESARTLWNHEAISSARALIRSLVHKTATPLEAARDGEVYEESRTCAESGANRQWQALELSGVASSDIPRRFCSSSKRRTTAIEAQNPYDVPCPLTTWMQLSPVDAHGLFAHALSAKSARGDHSHSWWLPIAEHDPTAPSKETMSYLENSRRIIIFIARAELSRSEGLHSGATSQPTHSSLDQAPEWREGAFEEMASAWSDLLRFEAKESVPQRSGKCNPLQSRWRYSPGYGGGKSGTVGVRMEAWFYDFITASSKADRGGDRQPAYADSFTEYIAWAGHVVSLPQSHGEHALASYSNEFIKVVVRLCKAAWLGRKVLAPKRALTSCSGEWSRHPLTWSDEVRRGDGLSDSHKYSFWTPSVDHELFDNTKEPHGSSISWHSSERSNDVRIEPNSMEQAAWCFVSTARPCLPPGEADVQYGTSARKSPYIRRPRRE